MKTTHGLVRHANKDMYRTRKNGTMREVLRGGNSEAAMMRGLEKAGSSHDKGFRRYTNLEKGEEPLDRARGSEARSRSSDGPLT